MYICGMIDFGIDMKCGRSCGNIHVLTERWPLTTDHLLVIRFSDQCSMKILFMHNMARISLAPLSNVFLKFFFHCYVPWRTLWLSSLFHFRGNFSFIRWHGPMPRLGLLVGKTRIREPPKIFETFFYNC